MVTPQGTPDRDTGVRTSILAGIISEIDITNHLDVLEDILSPVTTKLVGYSSEDLHREGKSVYSVDPNTGDKIIWANFFKVQDAETFMRNNTDAVKNHSQVGLKRLKKFRTAWEEGDTEKQRELFEGLYLLASTHLGEDKANHLRLQFLEALEYRYLQQMVNAITSGQEGIKGVKDMAQKYDINDPDNVEAAYAVNSIRYLTDMAREDSYAQEIHRSVCMALENYMELLQESENEQDWAVKGAVADVLTVFNETALIPKRIKKATPENILPQPDGGK